MPQLHSSVITHAEYDESSLQLTLWFLNQSTPHTYFGVPKDVYDQLISTPHAEDYFGLSIRGKYGTSRATERLALALRQ